MKININDKLYRFCFWSDARKQIPKSSKYYPIVSSRMWQVSNDQDTTSNQNLSLEQCKHDLKLIKQIQPYILISSHTSKILEKQLRISIIRIQKYPDISIYKLSQKHTHMISKIIGLSAILLAVFSVIIFIANYFIQSDVLNYIDIVSSVLLIFCCISLLLNVPKLYIA